MGAFVCVCVAQASERAKNMDWWSKYYASAGELRKCGDYLAKG